MALTKVTSGVIAANAVVDSFGTQSITGDKIGLNAITGNTLASNIINANNIVNGTITSAKIDTVANTQLTGTITTAQLGTGAVSNTKIASGAVEQYFADTGYQVQFRNRIINGDMRIDQRNAGAAVTSSGAFPVDRFVITNTTDGAFSAQQDSSSNTVVGFTSSLKYTVTTADSSLSTTQVAVIRHKIEGTNVSDLAWGSASAKTVTLSFQVRSSVTGTFGGVLRNSADDRSYPFTYSISVADTWETKSITIPGDTSGTWLTTIGIGIQVIFSLGSGSSRVGTAGAWAAAEYTGATGETNLMATLNATWYITGVQLEVGSVATPFERRPYGTELMLCQRYFNRVFLFGNGLIGFADTTTAAITMYYAPTTMRSTPTLSTTGTASDYQIRRSGTASTICSAVPTLTSTSSDNQQFRVGGTVASGLTAGDGVLLNNNAGETWIAFSAEL